MTVPVRIRITSALAVEHDGRALDRRELGSRKARTLLALLAAERGRQVPVDRIVEVIWPDAAPADPPANVATLVSRLRRLLGPSVVSVTGRSYGLPAGGDWSVDVDEAAVLADEAEARLAATEHAVAAAAARGALALLGSGPALPDEGDGDWVLAARREVDGLRRRSRHLLSRSVATLDGAEAVQVATAAVEADLYDERAVRDLMRALAGDGQSTAALATYDALAARLREELGTDPDRLSRDAHLALLRGEPPPGEHAAVARPVRPVLIGREPELGAVDLAWQEACSGRGSLLLVEGEAGIGKTRLLDAADDLAGRSGGLVLRARCHPTERSLFLQPYVDALRPLLLDLPARDLAELVRDHTTTWVGLVPDLRLLVTPEDTDGTAEMQRRRAYDAVASVLQRLAARQPVLLLLDDLHDAGQATVELLDHLARHRAGDRLLVLGAARSEHQAAVAALGDAHRLTLRGLPPSAVEALAAAAGLASRGAEVMARTAGHPLSVVEILRSLSAGDPGVPSTLADAVLARVAGLDAEAQELVRAASVLGRRLDPRRLAELAELSELTAVRGCEVLAVARLLDRRDAGYEFANDLVQECVHGSLPPALAIAYHRRAADLTTDQPEEMAEHSFAAGDLERAAQGWLLAGEAAVRRAGVADARVLFGRGLDVTADPVTRGRLLLARSRVDEALLDFAGGLADIDEALGLARASGDRRLEMAARRARGGDVPVALRQPMSEIAEHLEAGLAIASGLGDRRAEADFTTRLAVLTCAQLDLAGALDRAEAGVRRARAAGSPEAEALALDGLKTVWSYLADPGPLAAVLADLEPALRLREVTWLLQWAVFESSLVSAAADDWASARSKVEEAVALTGRTGYRAYARYFASHQGWYDRLAGDLDGALAQGRSAYEHTSPVEHPWWFAAAAGFLAATLVEAGNPDEAATIAGLGLAATHTDTPAAGRLRCLAPLALVDPDGPSYVEAHAVLDTVACPPGTAWVGGADCYLLLARADLARGDVARAGRTLRPLLEATRTAWPAVQRQAEAVLGQISSATS